MAIDISVTVTAAAGAVTINPRDLTDAEETMFLDHTWFGFGPRDVDGVLLERTNANQAQALRNWTRDMLRREYRAMVLRERTRAANTATSAVPDFSDAADAD